MYLKFIIFLIIVVTNLSNGDKTVNADIDNSESVDESDEKIQQLIINRRLKQKNNNGKLKHYVTKRKFISENWGYGIKDGPSTWPAACQAGKHQSPINIDLSHSEPIAVTKFKFVNYNLNFTNLTIVNVGHGIMVSGFNLLKDNKKPHVYGGNLNVRYYLDQFHFHWSRKYLNGSEHTVDSQHHPAEIHFVHTKEGLTMEEATLLPDGIAVMGVFVDLGDDDTALESLSNSFNDLIDEGSETTIDCVPGNILPKFTPWFFRYEGSLTTPSCAESVIWTVFLESISITLDQFQALRRIRIANRAKTDARPIQPLNDRNVTLCLATLPCTNDNCLPTNKTLFFKSSSSSNYLMSFMALVVHLILIYFFKL